jgi:hypothetical protein
MASYLNNTSDIILDAVLTDYGRQLLAKGDGSFNIVKFAFGDDEIDYSLYNTGAVSPNQDTLLMSTPILEAFTNNIASMNSKLLTIRQENLLFLPILKLNQTELSYKSGSFNTVYDGFVVAVDPSSDSDSTSNASTKLKSGTAVLQGVLATSNQNLIVVDQGLDSTKLNKKESLEQVMPELYETEYNIFIDSRFGMIKGLGEPLAVDDDYIATYSLSVANAGFVSKISTELPDKSSIEGTKGTRIQFGIVPTKNLETSNVYFTTYGRSGVALTSGQNFKTIRSVVEVQGIKTGYSIEIPILFAKI